MFHLELFSSSNGTSGANTFIQTNYVSAGAVLPAISNGMQVSPNIPFLMAVAGVGSHMVHIRPQSPSQTSAFYSTLSPNNRGTAFESPPRIWDFSGAPLMLKPTEEFDIFTSQNSGGAETQYVACLFSDGTIDRNLPGINPASVSLNPGQIGHYFTAHATAATTLSAAAWTQVTPAFDNALYAGYYAIIGMRVFSATGLFFRLYPATGPVWRPGGTCVQAYDSLDPVNQRGYQQVVFPQQGWGVWHRFMQNVPPTVGIFATSADTAEEFWFDLVYLGPNTIQAI